MSLPPTPGPSTPFQYFSCHSFLEDENVLVCPDTVFINNEMIIEYVLHRLSMLKSLFLFVCSRYSSIGNLLENMILDRGYGVVRVLTFSNFTTLIFYV